MRVGILDPGSALAFVAVGVLVALHLYGQRRRVIPVGTLFLWRRVPARALERRRFRPDLLFLAQLAVLLALIGGYLRPFLDQTAPAAERVRLLVVLDASASMQAREPGGTRFELARRRARALVAQLLTGDDVMLVAAAERAHVVLRWTADHAAAQGRLEALEPLDTPTNLAPALELALGEAAARPETQVVVLTDLPPEASALGPGRIALVDWVQIGRTDDNVAIAGLTVDEPPFRPVGEASATVLIRNYGHAARRVVLEATVGGEAWARRELEVAARGVEQVHLTEPPAPGPLAVLLATGDALPVDDRAVGWIDAPVPLDLALVSDSPAAATTFDALGRALTGSKVTVIAPGEWADGSAQPARVAVFHRFAPEPGAVAMPALYVEPPAGNTACPTDGAADDAAVIDWDDGHPALRQLDALQAVMVVRATRLATPDWARPLALAASGGSAFPLLVAGERGGRRVACLGATPLASSDDLPLLVLTLGVLRWLAEPPDGGAVSVPTGAPVLLDTRSPRDADDPGLRVAGDPPVLVAVRTGLHRVGARVVAANLFDDRESDIGRDGGGEWPAAARTAAARPDGMREIGRWLYLAAVVLLAVEWLLWRRRAAGGDAA